MILGVYFSYAILWSCTNFCLTWLTFQRGWTTWTTGIVDKRVIAIVPIVEDMLNINPVRATCINNYSVIG